jgi:enoyl-[acyl-carrier-protein] reductase (NADH)
VETGGNRCDVRNEDDVKKAIAGVDKKWKDRKIGGVVHCGGVGMAGKVRLSLSPRSKPTNAEDGNRRWATMANRGL